MKKTFALELVEREGKIDATLTIKKGNSTENEFEIPDATISQVDYYLQLELRSMFREAVSELIDRTEASS